ncbi:hypothetical protein JAAARDRAFT_194348 [Jaapia argillacea MUCL 33604]|uniref:F-box domain-containing protein n=1 Tax=Jaapia argillacea MUCL 33604 TaxID=933084 RepID=A0A067PQT5_9AGAM|nr:hypothetical protein JAAARDRAFT_194348 [Jaapia argillacea MUCL 33604]
MSQSCVDVYPPELLFTICAHIYSAGLPSPSPSLDPLITSHHGIPTSLPSSLPPANWPEPLARKTLSSLCLVNRSWYEAAKPWLWRKVEVRLPRSWLALIEQIVSVEDDDASEEQTAMVLGRSIQDAETAVMAARNALGECSDKEDAKALRLSILESLGGPDSSIPPELLSPPASRDPSPRRLRAKSKSPVRWKLMRSINDAVQSVLSQDESGVYVPTLHDPHPGRFIRHIDFNHFRTIGMRRYVDEGVNSRFVTGERVEDVLKEMPNLTAFGATEYMDGALTLPVLKELFLRGAPSRGRGRSSRGRSLAVPDAADTEEEDRERRRECLDLEAVDLTGCVSAVFVNALTEFVNTYILQVAESDSSDSEGEGQMKRGRKCRTPIVEPIVLPGLQRLGLLGAKSLPTTVLHPFVLSLPSLTHLDLSCTRVTPDLLVSLATSDTVRLQALSLGRCIRLTGLSIRDFLVHSPVASQIRELSLYGDGTFGCPLSEDELRDVLTLAPCFTSGQMVYLDLSSAPLTKDLMRNSFPPQPRLRSFGLCHVPNLELDAIADFLKTKAANVEVLALVSTSPELGYGEVRVSTRSALMALHSQLIRPLCVAPFSLSGSTVDMIPTRLRVLELSPAMLAGLGAGAGSWRIVKSKGGRGWYVDTASGWVTTPDMTGAGSDRVFLKNVMRRDLERDHPLRSELERLADANGNVSSGVGWHARKMEILHGHGLLGREDGLYGAVSFAYQG